MSPDGKWLAYQSDVSGRDEIYVQTFPVPGNREDVSPDGRFVMIKESAQVTQANVMNVVLNWFDELKKKVPPGR